MSLLGVWALGFKIRALGFQGFGPWVLGFRVPGFGPNVADSCQDDEGLKELAKEGLKLQHRDRGSLSVK